MSGVRVQDGAIAAELAAEFPGLRLCHATVAVRPGPSPPELVDRLRRLADRDRGAGVVALRTRPVPSAYRTFFRQIGLDPDVQRTPVEAAAVARLLHGGLRSQGWVPDACLVALVETGVPVWALDAGTGDGAHRLGIRTGRAGEQVGPDAAVTPGSLVVADEQDVRAILFDDPVPPHRVSPRTRAVTLYAVAVDGVPEVHLQEAIWIALDLLGAPMAG